MYVLSERVGSHNILSYSVVAGRVQNTVCPWQLYQTYRYGTLKHNKKHSKKRITECRSGNVSRVLSFCDSLKSLKSIKSSFKAQGL